jgi:hypothetical protein
MLRPLPSGRSVFSGVVLTHLREIAFPELLPKKLRQSLDPADADDLLERLIHGR